MKLVVDLLKKLRKQPTKKPRHSVGDTARIAEPGNHPVRYLCIGEAHWPKDGEAWAYSGFMFEIVGTVVNGKPAGLLAPAGYVVDVPEAMLVKVRGMHL